MTYLDRKSLKVGAIVQYYIVSTQPSLTHSSKTYPDLYRKSFQDLVSKSCATLYEVIISRMILHQRPVKPCDDNFLSSPLHFVLQEGGGAPPHHCQHHKTSLSTSKSNLEECRLEHRGFPFFKYSLLCITITPF